MIWKTAEKTARIYEERQKKMEDGTMKNLVWYMLALFLTGALLFAGTSSAGWFGSDDKQENEAPAEVITPAEEPAAPPAAAEKEALPEGEEITLSGTIDDQNRFVADNGEAYELSENELGMEIQSLSGKQLEIKGTVMEEEGQKTVEVTDYQILE